MNEAFLRSYRKILTAVLILLLLPLTVACFYDRPLGDELIQSLDAVRAWRESGSLLQTFQKAFQMMARDYQTRSGIFFSMLLFAMPLSVFGGNWLVGVNALLTILLMLYGFWRVAGCLQSLCRGISQEAVRCAGLLLGLMALLLLPDYHESIYWFGGAINYTVMSALAMLLFSAVFRAALDGKAPVWRLCLWCVGFFCLGGTNWMTPASSIVLYGAMAVWILITRRPKRLLLPYLFLLLGFATAALAPGNAARQETMNANVSFISAFLSSFQHSVLYFFSDARYWLFLLFPAAGLSGNLHPHTLFLPCAAAGVRRVRLRHGGGHVPSAVPVQLLGSPAHRPVFSSAVRSSAGQYFLAAGLVPAPGGL